MTDGIVRHKTLMPIASPPGEAIAQAVELAVHEYLAFELADEQYALPLTSVREILKLPRITDVPRARRDVLGIISVRGRLTTVIDLRRRLRMPEAPHTKASRVLLVDGGDEILGVLVDRVLSVFRLLDNEVELAAAVGGDTADYVHGVGRPQVGARALGRGSRMQDASATRDDILILLDPRPLLNLRR